MAAAAAEDTVTNWPSRRETDRHAPRANHEKVPPLAAGANVALEHAHTHPRTRLRGRACPCPSSTLRGSKRSDPRQARSKARHPSSCPRSRPRKGQPSRPRALTHTRRSSGPLQLKAPPPALPEQGMPAADKGAHPLRRRTRRVDTRCTTYRPVALHLQAWNPSLHAQASQPRRQDRGQGRSSGGQRPHHPQQPVSGVIRG